MTSARQPTFLAISRERLARLARFAFNRNLEDVLSVSMDTLRKLQVYQV